MSEKITKLVKELQEKNEELQSEMKSLSENNLSILDNSKKEFEWDKDLLKEWHEEYWHTYSNQNGENEWFIAVPKFIPFSLGWLDHTTKGYNVFKINQYTQWLGEMPEFLRKELNIKEPEKIFVSDGNLVFTEGKEDEIKDRYGDLLSSVSKGTARVKLGKEFDLIAKIIENGSLPFVPKQVDERDIISNPTSISFEGKYIFQKHAWDNFLKYGAIGIYWMTGCFDVETEILTKGGWKKYNELDYTDEFMTLNKKNNNLEYQRANKIFQYLYDGKMFNLETRQVNINVTPGHNMFVAKGNGVGKKIWRICKPKDIFNKKCYFKKDGIWKGDNTKYFFLPKLILKTKEKPSIKIPIEEWVKFFGLWLAEGHTTSDSKGNYKVGISMFDNNLLNEMHSFLKSWGFNPNKQYRNKKFYRIECCSKQLFLYLKQFGKASQKYIPNRIKELSSDLLKDLLIYFEYGDGEHSKGVTRLITSSIKLRDDLQEIALKSGYSANFNILMKRGGERKIGERKLKAKQDIWRITIVKKQNEPFINPYRTSSKSLWKDYKGIVWCVNVPNHIIYVRRNGKTWWSGNSGKDIFSCYALSRIKVMKDGKLLPNLYISPNLTILEQMRKDYFPKYAPELLKNIENGSLILSTYQGHDKLKDKEYGLTIYGECHVLPADTFSRLATLKTKYRIGQSASPYREDGRHSYIFALTGFPIGLNWQDLMKLLGKKYHDINVYIFDSMEQKIRFATNLVAKETKTLLFVDKIEIGERLANILGVPFIHGTTKNRIEIAKESKVFIASRVMEMGISIKDLEHVIEVDFLYGSKREEIQRTGRLFHSESKKAKKHDILMTKEEFESYGKRLHGLVEKGFKINLRPMVTGSFQIKKPEIIKGKGKSSRTGKDYNQIVEDLFDEGFFRNPIQCGELHKRVAKRGIVLSARIRNNINNKLNNLVRSRKIAKFKQGKGFVYQER